MLDEGVCLLCGRPVAANAVYCSRECSNIDSSSSTSASASAASSAQHSPMMYPVDSGATADTHPNSDIPALVHTHLRNRQSMSSNSTLDSDDYVYGANRRPSINYSRRPSATNQRSTIPSLLHRRTSSTTSEVSYARLAEQDPSFAIAKALNELPLFSSRSAITSSSSSSSPDFSSDDEPNPQHHLQRGGANQRTITYRHRNPLNDIRLPPTTTNATSSKKQHRVSLPAYFSRLSVEASTGGGSASSAASLKGERGETGSLSDHDTPIQPHGHAQSYPSPRSNPSSSSGFNTSTTLTSGVRVVETTPRGRGRDRRVRQGASRSPHARPRRSHSRSLSHSFSRSRSPSLSASPYQLKSQDGLVIGRPQTQPRTAMQAATSPTHHTSHRHSLGERTNRVHIPVAAVVAAQPEEVGAEVAPRGRRARGEDGPTVEGEERDRGRSRVVVKRGNIVTAGAGVAVQ